MAAEHKGNMGRFLMFLFIVMSNPMGTFPSSKIGKAIIELHFYRTRDEDNFSLATAFCDRKNPRQTQ